MRVALALVVVSSLVAGTASAQQPLGPSLSVGVGAGIAGASGGSGTATSDKKAGVVVTAAVDFPVAPLVMIGLQEDYWRRTVVNALFATAVVTVHLSGTPLSVKAGGGFGRGDFGGGALSGLAGQLGAVYEIAGWGPAKARLFANGFLASGSPQNVQLIDAGILLAWR
jgi:hypothetical protein